MQCVGASTGIAGLPEELLLPWSAQERMLAVREVPN